MNITETRPIAAIGVTTDEDEFSEYTRYEADAWYRQMGESDEPVYDCEELEDLYQRYIKNQNEEIRGEIANPVNALMSDQLLALLVMDLGYLERPLYGHAPIRHQRAWQMCVDSIGDEVMGKKISSMNDQAESEAPTVASMLLPALLQRN